MDVALVIFRRWSGWLRTTCARRSKLLGWAVANTGVIARE
jgi:hypothetical protein